MTRHAAVLIAVFFTSFAGHLPGAEGPGGNPALKEDQYLFDRPGGNIGPGWQRQVIVGSMLKGYDPAGSYTAMVMLAPQEGAVFPSDAKAPTFIWRDPMKENRDWIVEISFETIPHRVYVLSKGKRVEPDPEGPVPDGADTNRPPARAWTPIEGVWPLVRGQAGTGNATVAVLGISGSRKGNECRVSSRGSVTFKIGAGEEPAAERVDAPPEP